mgnify:CR=1 FL=1
MPKLPRTTARKVLSALLRAGFYVHHQAGGHINLRHEDKTHLHVVIPRHNKDLSLKTIRSIVSQTELNLEEFIKLL